MVAIVAFRSRNRAVLDRIREANKRWLNPAMLYLAGRPHWYASRVEHVGRRSGRPYATPVVAVPVEGGLVIPLPYGPDVDWCRNLRAAGGGTVVRHGRRHHGLGAGGRAHRRDRAAAVRVLAPLDPPLRVRLLAAGEHHRRGDDTGGMSGSGTPAAVA